MNNEFDQYRVVLLAGGVGGAKLAHGLVQLLPPENLTIVVNTGDDFTHLGLKICPDLDTVMYTLGKVGNPKTGWGRRNETWRVMNSVQQFGGPDWFNLGDLDLGVHLTRTHWQGEGQNLTEITQQLCQRLFIEHSVLPMSNQLAPTQIETNSGILSFQDWFVKNRWQPVVNTVLLPEKVMATHQVTLALQNADLVIIAPSNPFVSIDPILNCYPIRSLIMDLPQAVVAMSPIIGDDAIKGPAAKLMEELGLEVLATAVADYYGDLLDGFVYDEQDAGLMDNYHKPTLSIDTMMIDDISRRRIANEVLQFAHEIATQNK